MENTNRIFLAVFIVPIVVVVTLNLILRVTAEMSEAGHYFWLIGSLLSGAIMAAMLIRSTGQYTGFPALSAPMWLASIFVFPYIGEFTYVMLKHTLEVDSAGICHLWVFILFSYLNFCAADFDYE